MGQGSSPKTNAELFSGALKHFENWGAEEGRDPTPGDGKITAEDTATQNLYAKPSSSGGSTSSPLDNARQEMQQHTKDSIRRTVVSEGANIDDRVESAKWQQEINEFNRQATKGISGK